MKRLTTLFVMNRQGMISMIAVMAAALTACGNNNYDAYVELNALVSEAEEEPSTNTETTDTSSDYQVEGYDTTTFSCSVCAGGTFSANEVYLYTSDYRLYFATGECDVFCDVTGCKHNTDNCEDFDGFGRSCVRYYGNDTICLVGDSICYRSAESVGTDNYYTVLYTNSFSTEYSRKNYPTNEDSSQSPTMLSDFIFMDDHTLLVKGVNYVFTFDLDSNTASDPVEVCDSTILSITYLDNQIFISNFNAEVYCVDIASGTSTRMLEEGYYVKAANGRLWYAAWVDGVANLYSNNADFTDEVLEVTDASVVFSPCEDGILLDMYSDNRVDLVTWEGERTTLFTWEEVEEAVNAERDSSDEPYIYESDECYYYKDGVVHILLSNNEADFSNGEIGAFYVQI